jgi:DNA-directed RNA polymerase subunit RPC12/RpoP
MGVDIAKLLVKCSNCGYRFFTKKQTLSKTQVNEKRGALTAELKDHKETLVKLTQQLKHVNDRLSNVKMIIREIEIEKADLDAVVQCSKCGLRFHAFECEVKN